MGHLWLLGLWGLLLCAADPRTGDSKIIPKVTEIIPKYGSINGATRLTIKGEGFAQANQFNYGVEDAELGSSVQLVSSFRSFSCDVERDASHSTQITCYTRAMPEDSYTVRVSVDGVPITENNTCQGHIHSRACSFYVCTLITIQGRIFTDVYGSNTALSSNGKNVRILRYGLKLDDPSGDLGSMICKTTGTYIEVTAISPSRGSIQGGTMITISGRFFDQTDFPVRVLVGGQACDVLNVTENSICCKTPPKPIFRTVSAGGRGLKLEVWNNSRPVHLEEVLKYNEKTPGYLGASWVDSASYIWPMEQDTFVARFSGFLVAPDSDVYRFYIKGDDRYAIYFSPTGLPEDKVKIAYHSSNANSYFSSPTQRSDDIPLQKGKEYYIEILLQEYRLSAFVDVGLYQYKNVYSEQQTEDAINEEQVIQSQSTVVQEVQVITLENWETTNSTKEVQKVTVTSPCIEVNSCSLHQYRLIYNMEKTVWLPADASDVILQSALNDLWSLKPDSVQVIRTKKPQSYVYMITFLSTRGDFNMLGYEVFEGHNVTLDITEQTKGKPSLDTFTLNWGGIMSKPLIPWSSEAEFQAAVEEMVSAKCPQQIANFEEGYVVKYFRDYETDFNLEHINRGQKTAETDAYCGRYSLKNPAVLFDSADVKPNQLPYGDILLFSYNQLCLAYKGFLANNIGLKFKYQDKSKITRSTDIQFTYNFVYGNNWTYTCIDLLNLIQTKYTGTNFSLQRISLQQASGSQSFYVDIVYIGQTSTMSILDEMPKRRLPALANKGIFLKHFQVNRTKINGSSMTNQYSVTMTSYNCSYNIPMMAASFGQIITNEIENESVYRGNNWPGESKIRIRRIQAASPPLSGSFDVQAYGHSLKGLPAAVSATDLQFALQSLEEVGRVSVTREGTCAGFSWNIKWRSSCGKQNLLQVNDSNIIGEKANMTVTKVKEGGLFRQRILGDLLRTPTQQPQVEVYVNGIPSKCSGDCGFTWDPATTPIVRAISPSQGSYEESTILTILGSGFSPSSAVSVSVGSIGCSLLSVDENEIKCQILKGSAGHLPVAVSVDDVGLAQNVEDEIFYFVYQNQISHIRPASGSLAGGTLLTLSGFGFHENSKILVGNETCSMIYGDLNKITCRTPKRTEGTVDISVITNGFQATAKDAYSYNCLQTPVITDFSPKRTEGTVDISVITNGFQATAKDAYSYNCLQTPVITDFSPKVRTILGEVNLTIKGYNFGTELTQSMDVYVGGKPCQVLHWNLTDIRCLLPRLPPGKHDIHLEVRNWGFASTRDKLNASIRYVLEVTNMFPQRGSLYGGTEITIMGLGFSTIPAENTVLFVLLSKGVPVNLHLESSVAGCLATKPLCGLNDTGVKNADRLLFELSGCFSPSISNISPSTGTVNELITITGNGFSNLTCANKVTIGSYPCLVEESSIDSIVCHIDPQNSMDVGIREIVTLTVYNLGTAINTLSNEFDRRFVLLPNINLVLPNAGSTTGMTKVTIKGSGFTVSSAGVEVLMGRFPCKILSMNYTAIECETSPAPQQLVKVDLRIHGVPARCQGNCSFSYLERITTAVTRIFPNSLSGSVKVLVEGEGFGTVLEDIAVFIGSQRFQAIDVNENNITVLVTPLPAGLHPVSVVVGTKGLALGNHTVSSPAVASVTPTSGSIGGGTTLVITGNGFYPSNTTVTVGDEPCRIISVNFSEVYCHTPARTAGRVSVKIFVNAVAYPPLSFTYAWEDTPLLKGIVPNTGPPGTRIQITGSNFGIDILEISVMINNIQCNVTMVNASVLQCITGDHAGGTFPVMMHHKTKGSAVSTVVFKYPLTIQNIHPNQGSFGGGQTMTVTGTGFNPQNSTILVCGSECAVDRLKSDRTTLLCKIPPNNGEGPEQACDVSVVNGKDLSESETPFTYSMSLTSLITEISPKRGSTAGGTRLTIMGSGFSENVQDVLVTIAEAKCDVEYSNKTYIICMTNACTPSGWAPVHVTVGSIGMARQNNADFFYVDTWSSNFSWGGKSPPEEGSLVVIAKGQTILLDQNTPILKMLLIQGGMLIFDEADIELQAENILITDGGILQIGTEASPFRHKAVITLHGHLRSPELPVYGAKTLAVREGILDLHGLPVPVIWTRLAHTAWAGEMTLILQEAVTWKPGDKIVIASTGHRHSQQENEKRTIASVSANGINITLSNPLNYTHLGITVTLPDGTLFEARAEVGILTRNILIRGSDNAEWNNKIPACPEGFDTGEFATQTCLQGKFGEEIGSDQFGGCIMFHAPVPGANMVTGRIEYVEVFHAGQAFRLGRYPIHWHLLGDLQFKSYVRGCAIHQTYNRAVTIHNTHHLLVERNIIYDIKGGAFFIEDGIEHGNILQYNLAVFVQQSTSLLNDDVTPAAFWVTNPNNTIRHNAAAGGTHFGFWYRMNNHPDGPSYDRNICQKRVPLGEFFNNTVHSQGWFGMWIFEEYFPMQTGSCISTVPVPAIFNSLTTWNCQKGAEWVNGGALQFHNFVMINNYEAGIETKRILAPYVGGWGETNGAMIKNAKIVGHLDELGMGSAFCTTKGLVLPFSEGLTVSSVHFMNFDRPNCVALGVTSITGVCNDRCGGWSAKFVDIQYFHTPNKAGFRWEHEVVLIDVDGSLTGHQGHTVVPHSSLLDPSHCTQEAEWSVGFPGSVCDASVSFHRLAFNKPSPVSLLEKDVVLSDSFGTSIVPFQKKRLTHMSGWMALIPNAKHINWYFKGVDHITNISYTSTFYGFKEEDYVIISHNFTQNPDMFNVIDMRNGSSNPLNWNSSKNGDWHLEANTSTLYYLGTWIVADTDIPPMERLVIWGVLELEDKHNVEATQSSYRKIVLNATYISLQGGRLIGGWEDNPFKGELQIVLRGNHSTPEWAFPEGPNQGSKVLGVFGELDLHGIPRSIYKTKLSETAEAGSKVLSLMDAVDWQEGEEIVITTTSYDFHQTEIRSIIKVLHDHKILFLNDTLSYTHLGERYYVLETGQSYTLAADVGILTRNIKILGEEYPGWFKESFGARVLVSSFTENMMTFKGNARISNVEFYHSGQEGFRDSTDPRYAVTFLNLGQIQEHGSSYIRGCAFHHGFSPAIGVFGTDGLDVDDNIIHFTVGEGIRIWGDANRVRGNLVALSVWPGTYQNRKDSSSTLWHAAIEVNRGTNTILQNNVVAGFGRAGYRIDGEPCSVVLQTTESVQIYNVTLVDNGMAISSMIYMPAAVSHKISSKTVQIKNSLIVGSSPEFNCSDVLTNDDLNIKLSAAHRSSRPPSGGRSGICWPTFASAHNMAPRKPHAGIMSYNAISGLLEISGKFKHDSTFVGFKNVCSGETNVIFITNPLNEDLQHPIHVKDIQLVDTTEQAKIFIHRPDISKVNPSDCVDMVCDAKRKSLLRDMDGSFLGNSGSVIPQSEYEWNGNSQFGIGDYRIPKVMLTYPNGTRIPITEKAPYKGIIRDSTCKYIPEWQSYRCFGMEYAMMVIESLDSDTETRRLSPVAIVSNGYVDLINGPQDHGWCAGYTCQRRLSLFHSIVALNKPYEVYFTGTSPQNLRLMLLNVDHNKRLDVYVNNALVCPKNTVWNPEQKYCEFNQHLYTEQFLPNLNSMVLGENYFDRTYQMLYLLVKGTVPVEIHTTAVIFVSFQLPAVMEDDFYSSHNLVRNLALYLKIPNDKIRVSKIIRGESLRRKRSLGLTVELEIGDPPSQFISRNTAGQMQLSELQEIAASLGQAVILGKTGSIFGLNISSMSITNPIPSPSDSGWIKVTAQPVERFAFPVHHVAFVFSLSVITQPVAAQLGQPFSQQPSVKAVDSDGNCVSVGITWLTLKAILKDANNNHISGLGGNTTIPFSSCWANYTDLALLRTGLNYKIEFMLDNVARVESRTFGLPAQSVSSSGGSGGSSNSKASTVGTVAQMTTIVTSCLVGRVLLLEIFMAAVLTLNEAPEVSFRRTG
ncbi:Fibrocystin-L [Pteropus alecto]|uniref:Fibrocystin-L n=1 Tax=Pteropus alecto TaxID=9402 RepID=L5KAN3_PTEAL|nr:Fibrocystin-L [Pteropus alecto]